MSITWLASYPKSGNTWMRVFLTNYVRDSDAPADVNALEQTPIASCRQLFDRHCGITSSDLTADEIDAFRPDVYHSVAAGNTSPFFMKVHDAYTLLPDGQPLFPDDATTAAIYIIRNPLDVIVSGMAHFNVKQVDVAVKGLATGTAAVCSSQRSLSSQLRQSLLGWSEHAHSWAIKPKNFPVLVVRYEDMLQFPFTTFQRVVRFAGLPYSDSRLEKAIAFSSFRTLQQQEATVGFRERVSRTDRFFRSGRIGNWTSRLNEHQVRRVLDDHHDVLKHFEYLTRDDRLVFEESEPFVLQNAV